ncbi:hypothetical protein NC651_012018 [Populus alba x Populus x berolinensis]|nr:hypothetical protein NC651_012018 [Populus alba x Populus x berolinensis]
MLNNEARRIKSLERESARLRAEISQLESKLGHGDFSAANTKVITGKLGGLLYLWEDNPNKRTNWQLLKNVKENCNG